MINHELYKLELKLKEIVNKYSLLPIDGELKDKIKFELDKIYDYHNEKSITYIIDEVEVKLVGFMFDFKFDELIIIPYWSVA